MPVQTPRWVVAAAFLSLGLLPGSGRLASADPMPAGAPILVEARPDSAYRPQIAVDPAGNFLVLWEDVHLGTARARTFWATGNARGAAFDVSEPGFYLAGDFTVDELAVVAADDAGNFVVAYNGYASGGADPACSYGVSCIRTRRYDANDTLSTASFVVGDPRLFVYEGEDFNQTGNPEITADGTGAFVVAWEGYDDDSEGVWARKLVGGGQSNGAQFRVNASTDGYQGDAGSLDVAADAAGNFVVVWSDDYFGEPPYGILAQMFDSAKNPIGTALQVTSEGEYNADAHVARAPAGGFMVVWENDDDGVSGRVFDSLGAPLTAPFVITADGYNPDVAASAQDTFVVVFDVQQGDDESRGVTFDASGTATSGLFTLGAGLPGYRYRPGVDMDDAGNFVVAWASDDSVYAQRFEVTPPAPQAIPVLGKVLVLTNKAPDDFEKSKGSWKASGSGIVSPLRGSSSDPRCNGDPEGTVKATARFVSATSGQDVTYDLPCQNWSATGSTKVGAVAKRGYKYSDPKREAGPCNSVKIKGTKSLSVSCKGKPGVASFDFDLQSGVSQGPVVGVLAMGLLTHCAEFQPFFDGSDGKKYKGKALAAPVGCPS